MTEMSWDDVTVLHKRPQRPKKVTGAQANEAQRLGLVTTERRRKYKKRERERERSNIYTLLAVKW